MSDHFYKPHVDIGSLDYKDVFLVPQYSEVTSRSQVSTSVHIGDMKIDVPVISANMDTVTAGEMALAMSKGGAIGAIHRFMDVEQNVREFEIAQGKSNPCFVSIGVNEESKERAVALYNAGARNFVIDIAHGHSRMMRDMTTWLRGKYSDVYIMAGNVATGQAVRDLVSWGANAVKIGIGPGCFAAGTRVLMANGQYKNIESILPGDRVINKDGIAVCVKGVESKGIRLVGKYKTNTSGNWTTCTPDHLHWVGDLSSTKQKTISSSGYAKLLDKKSKTIPKQSKYKWMEISEAASVNAVCLMPKNIKFELSQGFSINLYKRNAHTHKKENYATLVPTYELGYIFGTYLGDGHARSTYNKKRKSVSGSVSWIFGSTEMEFVNKLTSCITKTLNRNVKINVPKNKNTLEVFLYDKPFAEFLLQFGKRQNKKLPIEFLIDDTKYLQGLLDGLVDSDGSISKDGRIKFGNTSKFLAELFCVLNIILEKHVPNYETRKPTVGGLKNVNINNVRPSYAVRPLKNPKNRMTKEYQVVKILDSDFNKLTECEVFDIEVDDDTHSFIANNSIVHNSACTTKNVTGVTVPQFSAVKECAIVARNMVGNKPIIVADGGITEIGDIAKALGAGADLVMCGRLFAGCREAPGKRVGGKKVYRGMASRDAMMTIRNVSQLPTAEGISTLIDANEHSAIDVVNQIKGGLQSAFSYSNARNLCEFQINAKFGVRHTQMK